MEVRSQAEGAQWFQTTLNLSQPLRVGPRHSAGVEAQAVHDANAAMLLQPPQPRKEQEQVESNATATEAAELDAAAAAAATDASSATAADSDEAATAESADNEAAPPAAPEAASETKEEAAASQPAVTVIPKLQELSPGQKLAYKMTADVTVVSISAGSRDYQAWEPFADLHGLVHPSRAVVASMPTMPRVAFSTDHAVRHHTRAASLTDACPRLRHSLCV